MEILTLAFLDVNDEGRDDDMRGYQAPWMLVQVCGEP